MELSKAEWRGTGTVESVIASPSEREVRDAVTSLDGRELNDVYLHGDDGWWLAVCGGPSDFLVSLNNEQLGEYWVVAQEPDQVGEFEIVCGGQVASFPAAHRSDLDDAIAAATCFAVTGQRTDYIAWARV